jgi:hypothetical protein
MSLDVIPIGVLFAATIILVVIAIEAGYRLGKAVHRRSEKEKEASVSAIVGAILGLVAFILAFTFEIVSNRYDARKALVCDEANAISTAYLRTEFMSEPDRGKTKKLFKEYVDARVAVANSRDFENVQKVLTEANLFQHQLWDMAVANAFKDMHSPVAALYIDSLNKVIDIHALRVAVGLRARIPAGIWLVLYIIVVLGMVGVGYQTAITGSTERSWAMPLLALAFSLVIALIASLDRPQSGFITVTQQPLVDLQASMATDLAAPSGGGTTK